MAHDVFISYSSHDKTIADAVCATLERHGLRCWIAPRDIGIGQNWAAAIVHALGASRAMVLILSANANVSPQIHREVERAVTRGVAILPLRVEDVVPSEELEYFIGSVHWLDAITRPIEAHLDTLARKIQTLLGEHDEAADTPKPAPPQKTPRPGDRDPEPPRIPDSPSAPPPEAPSEPEDEAEIAPKDAERGTRRRLRVLGVGVLAVVTVLAIGLLVYWRVTRFTFDSESTQFEVPGSKVISIAFSPDGTRFATGSDDKTVKIWDITSGTVVATLTGHTDGVHSVAFSRSGAVLASAGYDNTIRLWNAKTGQLLQTVQGHREWVSSVVFSPVRNVLASGSLDNTVRLWEPGRPSAGDPANYPFSSEDSVGAWTLPVTQARRIETGDVASLAFSPDGRRLAVGELWAQISIWDMDTGRKIRSIRARGEPSPAVREVAFSADGRYLAAATYDYMDLWDVDSGDLVRGYDHEPGGGFGGVTFSADGRFLATPNIQYGADNAVRIWSLGSPQSLQTLSGPLSCQITSSVRFSPDAQWLVVGTSCGFTGSTKKTYLWRWKRR